MANEQPRRDAPTGHLALRADEPAQRLPLIRAGSLSIYQFYEVGAEIDLKRAQSLLKTPASRRQTPTNARQSDSIQIIQPPLWIELGALDVQLGQLNFTGTLRASVYDLGAVALVICLPLADPTDWPTVADLFATTQNLPEPLKERFSVALGELRILIGPAVINPTRSALIEDYSVLVVERLEDPAHVGMLADHPLVQAALLGERRPLSAGAAALISDMSYYPEDLALLSWNGALLVEPDPLAAGTATDLLEFANVELLLLRSYDADLEAELPRMYGRIAAARRRLALPLVRPYNRLLNDVQRLVIEITEVTERIDNALKVTDDVYWNRLYSTMLNVMRIHLWRAGVEHRLALLRETYDMLHDQAEAERSAVLEWIVIILILFEIIMAFVRH